MEGEHFCWEERMNKGSVRGNMCKLVWLDPGLKQGLGAMRTET